MLWFFCSCLSYLLSLPTTLFCQEVFYLYWLLTFLLQDPLDQLLFCYRCHWSSCLMFSQPTAWKDSTHSFSWFLAYCGLEYLAYLYKADFDRPSPSRGRVWGTQTSASQALLKSLCFTLGVSNVASQVLTQPTEKKGPTHSPHLDSHSPRPHSVQLPNSSTNHVVLEKQIDWSWEWKQRK